MLFVFTFATFIRLGTSIALEFHVHLNFKLFMILTLSRFFRGSKAENDDPKLPAAFLHVVFDIHVTHFDIDYSFGSRLCLHTAQTSC
jgi:hypothetical protein